jgi:hypothetical protein
VGCLLRALFLLWSASGRLDVIKDTPHHKIQNPGEQSYPRATRKLPESYPPQPKKTWIGLDCSNTQPTPVEGGATDD